MSSDGRLMTSRIVDYSTPPVSICLGEYQELDIRNETVEERHDTGRYMADVRVVDVVGFHCPVPVHETRKALSEMKNGSILEVISDDKESLRDIPALCDRMDVYLITVEEEAGEYTFRILNEANKEVTA